MTMNASELLLTSSQLAVMLKVSERTLKRWRTENTGPAWFRVGGKHVRYPAAGVRAYLEKRHHA